MPYYLCKIQKGKREMEAFKMIKSEKIFLNPVSEVCIGIPCIIQLNTNQKAKTSPVEKFYHNLLDGSWTIETKNTIYRSN